MCVFAPKNLNMWIIYVVAEKTLHKNKENAYVNKTSSNKIWIVSAHYPLISMMMNVYARMATFHNKNNAHHVVSPANNAHNQGRTVLTIEHHFMLW